MGGFVHGKMGSPEHKIWAGMMSRCSGSSLTRRHYKDRGIGVSPLWRGRYGFERFLEEIGLRPSPRHSIDRIDNDRGYEPGNVRWATQAEQNRNRRNNRKLSYNGETLTVTDWAARLGWSPTTLFRRIKAGLTSEQVIETPLTDPVIKARNMRSNRQLTAFGKTQPLAAWAEETRILPVTISARLARGWTVEKALSAIARDSRRGC